MFPQLQFANFSGLRCFPILKHETGAPTPRAMRQHFHKPHHRENSKEKSRERNEAPLIRCAPPPFARERKWKTQFWTKSEIAARGAGRGARPIIYFIAPRWRKNARAKVWAGFLWCRDTRRAVITHQRTTHTLSLTLYIRGENTPPFVLCWPQHESCLRHAAAGLASE